MRGTNLIVSYLEAARNEGGGEEASKGNGSPFSVSTATEKEKETAMEEVSNVVDEMDKEETENDATMVGVK